MPSQPIRTGACAALATAACLLLVVPAARADTFQFSGHFSADDDLAFIAIDVPGSVASPLTALTWSFAQGGFAPLLSVFDGQGFLLQTGASADPAACCDQRLALADALPGHYTFVLSQQGNYPGATLADPFSNAGMPHYTAVYDVVQQRPGATFIDVDYSQRSGFWAVDLNVAGTAAVVPEPAAGWLLVTGLAGLVGLKLRRRSATG